jgi:hypothetical protein
MCGAFCHPVLPDSWHCDALHATLVPVLDGPRAVLELTGARLPVPESVDAALSGLAADPRR